MNKRFKSLRLLAGIALFITACSASVVQAGPEEPNAPKTVPYQTMLGKSVRDQEVTDFIASNNCTLSGPFQLCQAAGLALWTDVDQMVRTVRLYVNNSDGFASYRGELPYGLKFYDIQGAVEYKLKRQGVGNEGLPDEGSSPDHFHYWAVYKQQNMIIVYNAPFPDEDATIHTILIRNS